LLRACREIGVSRLVHLGALGVQSDSKAPYARTKAIAEQEVDEAQLPSTVYSPSILFGRASELIRVLRRASFLPLVPVPRVETLFQPVFVGDMADLIADTISPPSSSDRPGPEALSPAGSSVHYEVAGPETLSGTRFADMYLQARGCRRVYLPGSAVDLGIRTAAALHLPGFPEQLPEMLSMKNVLTGAYPGIRLSRRYSAWLRE
jgi:NADH dehydrogenase